MSRPVVIVGGGLAGIAAAVRLSEIGKPCVLIETRKRLGGRATSLIDPRSGVTIDNCQHVVLGCCTHLIDLYERLGVLNAIEWHRTLYWTDGAPGREPSVMRASWLPAPFHLSPSFLRLAVLDQVDRRAVARAMWRIIRGGSKARIEWRGRTFGEYLESLRQPAGAVRRFWEPIIVSACNLGVARVAADAALHVIQDGFLGNRWSYTMGLANVPLGELYDPAVRMIEDAGGAVHLGVSAKALSFDGTRIPCVVTEHGVIECSQCIAAVPPDRLDKLLAEAARSADRRLERLNDFEFSPILGVHLWFDQSVMDLPHLVLVNFGVQWLFNKGFDDLGRQHLHAVISAADDWMDMREDEIVERIMGDLRKALPRTVGLSPVEARSIKEKRATFSPLPGVDDLRPATSPGGVGSGRLGNVRRTADGRLVGGGGIENLYLAGDWTDTGWPATMEGAVRSGYAAAGACLGPDAPAPIEDIPPGVLSRLLGL